MALPIRPTPILTGKDAERLEEYMAASEYEKEYARPIQIDWAKVCAAYRVRDELAKAKQ